MSLADLFRQLSTLIGLPAVLLAGVAAAIIVIARDWRLVLFAYGLLSTMLALLLSQVVPSEWALLQAIVGGMISVMLFLSARQLTGARHLRSAGHLSAGRWPQLASLTSFRVLAVAMAAIAYFAMRTRVQLPLVTPLFRDAVLWLSLMGLLGLALHDEPLYAGLSLLTVLGGFQLLLFTLVQRRMLIGLMEAEQLLLGLAISYLMLSHGLATTAPAAPQPAAGGPQPPRTSRWQA